MYFLKFKKEGICQVMDTNHDGMCSLAWLLDGVAWLTFDHIRKKIEDDLNKGKGDNTFNDNFGLEILDKNTLKVYMPMHDDPKYDLIIPKDALWKLVDEYDKIADTDWKEILVTFDGKEFKLDVTY